MIAPRTRHILLLSVLAFTLAQSSSANDTVGFNLPLVFADSFEQGAARWTTTDDTAWNVVTDQGQAHWEQTRRVSNFQPKYRSPHNIALVREMSVGDFAMTFRVKSLEDTGDHRDCCVFFGYQDAEHFYYIHLGAKPDPASGQIMLVNGADRRPLTQNVRPVAWDHDWHTVRVMRDLATGRIAIYFDQMDQPLMSVIDRTFGAGRVGVGSFDDRNAFDDVRLHSWSNAPSEPRPAPTASDAPSVAPDRPHPTHADVAYAHLSERQRFDLWLAPGDSPRPVVVLIHGGGWVRGDKSGYGRNPIQGYLDAGISVAAINYRFIAEAMEQQVSPPVMACVCDAARAVQTLRARAEEWNLDPTRIGASGGSAGACTSLWLALHDDLAMAESTDNVARQSSRLQAIGVTGAQTSLDPLQLQQWIANANYAGHAFGFAASGRSRPEEFALLLAHRDEKLPEIRDFSPIELVTPDDPPIFLEYPNQKAPPVLGGHEADPTHSAMYGVQFLARCQETGVRCELVYPGFSNSAHKDMVEFLIARLTQSP